MIYNPVGVFLVQLESSLDRVKKEEGSSEKLIMRHVIHGTMSNACIFYQMVSDGKLEAYYIIQCALSPPPLSLSLHEGKSTGCSTHTDTYNALIKMKNAQINSSLCTQTHQLARQFNQPANKLANSISFCRLSAQQVRLTDVESGN